MTSITCQSSKRSWRRQPNGQPAEFEIDPAPIWPTEDGRLEPIFLAGPLGVEFMEFEALGVAPTPGTAAAPPPVAFDKFMPLDAERGAQEPDEPSPAPRQRASAVSLLGSLGIHLPTLLVLVGWSSAPAELAGAIPVQLVVEQSSSAPVAAQADRPESASTSATPPPDSATGPAAAPPVPPPMQVAELPQPPRTNPPPPPIPAALPSPAPAVPPAKPPAPAANPAPSEARLPGSDTAPGDYLDYLVTLTRGHFDILPLAFLAGRSGRTTLSVRVFENGTISRIAVKRSSGYPDIDARIEQMVAAVGQFPPLPEAFQKPSVDLDFNMTFPDALQE